MYTSEHDQVVEAGQILVDAAQGTLPSFSILLPNGVGGNTSQHNQTSMALGDNWIGQVVGAIEGSTNWASTAIFITYDDCGCFYDHVPPPTHDWGIRVPMVIVSPFAKPGYTDSTPATLASMLAFTEHAFGLSALAKADARAYHYRDSFDYAQPPTAPVAMTTTPVPWWELKYIAAHPVDADDPT